MDRRVGIVAACGAVAAVAWVPRLISSSDERPDVAPQVVTVTGDARPTVGAAGDTGSTSAVPAEQLSVGPYGTEWGVPSGYVRTAQGAEAAAVGWVSSLGELMRMGPIARSDTLHRLLSTRIAEETVDDFNAERDRFIKTFGVDPSIGMWRESPLATSVATATESQVIVRVWAQVMIGSDDRVEVLWRTHTVTMIWQGDDWRVDDVTRVQGPTPSPTPGALPSPPADLDALADWTPAVLVGAPTRQEDD